MHSQGALHNWICVLELGNSSQTVVSCPHRRIVGTNLIIPHIVGNAGVLRNFSAYLAQLLDVNSKTDLQVHTSGLDLDFLAFGLSLGLTLLLILGTHETSLFNLGAWTHNWVLSPAT